MVRCILAVIVGAVVGIVFNWGVITLSHVIYPLHEGMDPSDMEAMGAYIASLPVPAFLLILVAHAGARWWPRS